MFEPVQPVPAAPPATSGLLRSAQVVNNPGERWEQGIAWRPERCMMAVTFDPCGDADGFSEPVGSPSDGIVYHVPTAFRIEDECSTRGRLDEGRVRRQAMAASSYLVAAELHSGAMSLENPYATPDSAGTADQVNHHLAQSTAEIIAGVWDIVPALGQLEDAARDATLGQDVFIHMPVAWVPLLGDAVTREGSLLRTRTGAVVVADAGYPGTGPSDGGDPPAPLAGSWMYATGPVQVRLSDVSVNRIDEHRSNTVIYVAERLFAATFDPCTLHAIEITAPAPTTP